MKTFKKILTAFFSLTLITGLAFGTPFVSNAEESDEVYYAQNGLVKYSGEGGSSFYSLGPACGYNQNITVYYLVEKRMVDLKTSYGFCGNAYNDPEYDSKKENCAWDNLEFDIYGRNDRKVADWGDGSKAEIHEITVNIMAGEYSFFYSDGIRGYGIGFTPLLDNFEPVENMESEKDLWFTVEEGKNHRVYAIFYNTRADEDEDFYNENIDDFTEWAVENERSLLEKEGYYDSHQGNTETIEVSMDREVQDAIEEIASVENTTVVTVEENAEIKDSLREPVTKTESKPKIPPFVYGIAGIGIVGLLVFFIVKKRR